MERAMLLPIVVGFDGSDGSELALEWAVAHARLCSLEWPRLRADWTQ